MKWSQTFLLSAGAGLFASGAVAGLVMSGTSVSGQGASAPAAEVMKAMEVVIAKDQIRDQIYNYGRGLDRMDKALALSIWNPGAIMETNTDRMTGPEWIDAANRINSEYSAHTHQMVNILIKVDGEKATSETYGMISLRSEPTPGSTRTTLIRNRYLDRWSKHNGRWGLDYRRLLGDFSTVEDSMTKSPPSAGRRDKTDPSYAVYF